ncbi:hypothetical protein SDC9_137130 [bioreactor metagenome]|uniref:Uncharacterized protein n=1 Tax=bioreactor metagenome TaxID=1076179 RepID=A0A645DKP5_9ZZZZ
MRDSVVGGVEGVQRAAILLPLPGVAPAVEDTQERVARLRAAGVRLRYPVEAVADHHRCAASHGAHERQQIGIGQHQAAVAGFGQSRELLRWRSVQPDAAA